MEVQPLLLRQLIDEALGRLAFQQREHKTGNRGEPKPKE